MGDSFLCAEVGVTAVLENQSNTEGLQQEHWEREDTVIYTLVLGGHSGNTL